MTVRHTLLATALLLGAAPAFAQTQAPTAPTPRPAMSPSATAPAAPATAAPRAAAPQVQTSGQRPTTAPGGTATTPAPAAPRTN